jgi:hypothetical protein
MLHLGGSISPQILQIDFSESVKICEICGSFGLAKTSIAQWTPVAPRISASACNTWLAACGRWADDAKRLAFVAFQLDAQLARI